MEVSILDKILIECPSVYMHIFAPIKWVNKRASQSVNVLVVTSASFWHKHSWPEIMDDGGGPR